jgi:MFS family permease
MAVLIMPIVVWLRLDPASKGQFVDGEPPAAAFVQADQTLNKAIAPQPDWGMREVLRTPAFWLVIVAGIGAIGPLRLLSVHQLAILRGAGVSLTDGSRLVGVAGAITAVTFILSGALSDKIGRRVTYILGSFCLLAAFGLIASISDPQQSGRLWLYALCLGMGEGSRSSLVSAVASDLFAGKALGGVNGAVGASYGVGAAVFPLLAGRWFDVTGNYNGIFLIAAVAVVLSAVALWVASGWQEAGKRGAGEQGRAATR